MSFMCCKHVLLWCHVHFRPMVTQLIPPKIPEGERVDFDVSLLETPKNSIKVGPKRVLLLVLTARTSTEKGWRKIFLSYRL